MASDPNCIFCKIVAGDIPCVQLLSDDTCLAFLDVGPLAAGHALLIPRDHYETIDQVPAEVASGMLGCLPSLVSAVMAATGAEGCNVLQNNRRVAHQLVPHVHFHVIPRNSGDEFTFNWPAGSYPEGEMARLAEDIRRYL